MARIRTIKPEFWTAEQVMELSRDARLLFIGMWNFCDDMGVHPAAYKTLKAEVFPGDDITSDDVKRMVGEIIQQGLLGEFEHEDRSWWYVTGWKHQLINRPSTSRYPRPPRIAPLPLAAGPDGLSGKGLDDSAETPTAAVDDRRSTHEECAVAHGALTEDSLPEGKGREGKGKEKTTPDHQASSEVQARPDPPAAVAADRFDATRFLVEQGADQQTAADYLELRKAKKAASTRTALRAVVAEAAKAGIPVGVALTTCCARGWAGFKADWVDPKPRDGPARAAKFDPVAHVNRNRIRQSETANIIDITAERLA